MILQLTEKTQTLIQDYIMYFIDNNVELDSDEELKHGRELAVEDLESNFEQVENNFQLLQDYYDGNCEVKNLPELKKLSCSYARSLI